MPHQRPVHRRGSQHLDNYMLVEHAQPALRQPAVLQRHSRRAAHGVFHGRIVVHKDAQKTDAKQTNRNLLLSDDAQIDTKPQLEIHADDVKCTHGATIGQIEEERCSTCARAASTRLGARTSALGLRRRVPRPHEASRRRASLPKADPRATDRARRESRRPRHGAPLAEEARRTGRR